MATIPPPYSARDAARAQRDAYKVQRDYWRMQRRPSIVRPILLIAIGIIALLIESDKINGLAFWDWYSRWWPLLLIGIGLLSLGEWWLERDRPYGARRGVGGIVFLIIVLAVAGSTSHLGWQNHRNWQPFGLSGGDDDLAWHLFGQQHDATTELEQAMPVNGSLRIVNPRGDVTISTSQDEHMHVSSRNVVFASSDKDAEKQLARIAPHLTVSGSQILLQTADINAAHADLTIEMPADASLDVNAGHGDVTVDGARSNVTVAAGKGDVKLDNISGNVHTHMTKGDFSATAISGEVVVEGRMDDVSLSGIKNHVSLNGDFFGDMHLQQITGPLNVHSSRTDITVASVPGNLTLDSGDLQFKNVNGPVRVITRSKDVEGTFVHGAAHIENSNGDITLTALAPLQDVSIHNDNGSIDLSLPLDAKFDLQASTGDGDMSSDFEVPQESQNDRHSANGKVGGGGATISVVTNHGDVRIRKAGANAEAPEPPEQPEKPERPSRPARHLHAPANDVPPEATVQ